MNTKMSRRQRDIKTKLMAAIAMLLVSSIMMVSTTYAWFTLSTAPEVTGIQTAVGANGNLEMALLPKDGQTASITSNVGDSSAAADTTVQEANVTWGNLVDVADSTYYGMDKITLYPSRLNLTDDGKIPTSGSILLTPVYGADGRVSELDDNTSTATYDTTNGFIPDEFFGVRAIGVDSGMTARELDYRNARSAGNSAMSLAATKATTSLATNGSYLATIAVEKGTGATEFSGEKVKYLGKILDDLQGTDGILAQIEKAYLQYILAYAASSDVTDENVYTTIKGWVEEDGATLNGVLAKIADTTDDVDIAITLPSTLTAGVAAYNKTVGDVATARTNYNALNVTDSGTYPWATSGDTKGIADVLNALADSNAMKVNGMTVDQIKSDDGMQKLVDAVSGGQGVQVTVATGGGVYADIADQCGDYKSQVKLNNIQYGGLTLNTTAWMSTQSTVKPSYISQLATAVSGKAPVKGAGDTMPLSDMYGYIVDLAFKTNAAESNLLLQQTGVDRIYDDQAGTETMGHGSTMTFQATTADFDETQMKALMGAIRIVFFDPTTGEVKASAKLNTNAATLGTEGWTATIYLYKITAGETTYSVATDAQKTDATTSIYTLTDGTYTLVESKENLPEGEYYVATKGADTETTITDNVIMALTQNQAHALSVLVYLDGDVVTNESVAATGTSSMTGTMNLQFASSANLVPMDYTNLHQGAKVYSVTLPTGVTGGTTATANTDYTFTVAAGYTLGEVTVDGTAVTPTAGENGAYTIPADKVTGTIVINVTAAGTN